MKCSACGEERPDFGQVEGRPVCSAVCAVALANRGQGGTLRVFKTEPASSFGTWTAVGPGAPADGHRDMDEDGPNTDDYRPHDTPKNGTASSA